MSGKPSKSNSQKDQGAPATILAIDDDEAVHWIVERTLKHLAAEILFTASPIEAEWILERQRIDLIVCDYYMGHNTGLYVLNYLKANSKEIPFVLYTSERESNIPHVSYQQYNYVRKPETAELARVVGELLGFQG